MGAAVPIAILAATAISTGMAVAGSVQEGQAASAQAKYQAQVARNNQILAEQKAKDAEARGKIAEQRQRMLTAQEIGKARASAAARGVIVDSGSSLVHQEDLAQAGEFDALTIRYNARREAAAHRSLSRDFGAEGELFDMSGQSLERQGQMQGFSSLIDGAGSVANKWYVFRQHGAM